MADLASMVLGSVQDTIVEAFGATTGWLIGHFLVLGILTLAVVAVQNRHFVIR